MVLTRGVSTLLGALGQWDLIPWKELGFEVPAQGKRVAMTEQPARLLTPVVEQVVAIQANHPHSPIC